MGVYVGACRVQLGSDFGDAPSDWKSKVPGLTDRSIRALRASTKPHRAFDAGGLYLEIAPSGRRYWRFKYRYGGKEKRLAIGVYPEVTLAAARLARDKARGLLRDGQDPSAAKKAAKLKSSQAGSDTFAAVTEEWLSGQKAKLSPATFAKAAWMFEKLLFPWLGS